MWAAAVARVVARWRDESAHRKRQPIASACRHIALIQRGARFPLTFYAVMSSEKVTFHRRRAQTFFMKKSIFAFILQCERSAHVARSWARRALVTSLLANDIQTTIVVFLINLDDREPTNNASKDVLYKRYSKFSGLLSNATIPIVSRVAMSSTTRANKLIDVIQRRATLAVFSTSS